MRAEEKGSAFVGRSFVSGFRDSGFGMMEKTHQGGTDYDRYHHDMHRVRRRGAEPGHPAAAGRYRRGGALKRTPQQETVDKRACCLYNIFG